ncbi:TPA: shikimate kinase AroL [Morganella morganii]|uniref:shikimate kinase AroL n=1 Tax=Morganella morganii TaxID=582 RepID=UPI00046A70F9|nr:shikimate kinase AroL [Morganella morganii]HDF2342680.1 shikimate kinase AroL [Morganella morganii]HDF2344789.1 shikimate kinase AroL [Morganella morganii]
MNHQDEKPIIYLIGARGAGKTTLGKPLAQALLYDFIDTDACVTEQCRMSISRLVEQSGWLRFRELESDVLRQVSQPQRLVSTGGGIVMAPENRAFMQSSGKVVYLRASAETLAERLSHTPQAHQRPSLTGKCIVEEMAEVLSKRDPLYLECADIVVDATCPVPELISQICTRIHAAV